MSLPYPRDLVGRQVEWADLDRFIHSGRAGPSLGIVWGRRRVGKSFMLGALVERSGGFLYQAVRGASAEALRELGAAIGAYEGVAAPLALPDWDAAITALLDLGRTRELPVVLDEFPYLLEHTPELPSILQRAVGTRSTRGPEGRARLVLCGSAMSVMGALLSGTAPLHGRAGLDLRVSPFDFRLARELHGIEDLACAERTYSVIGGVAAYAREMVEDDLPTGPRDFDRWICRRVLSPSSPLFNEVGLLLSEDPSMSGARKINLYHAALAGIATGNHAHSKLTKYMRVSGASLAPIVESLVAAELVERVEDPLRDNRPTYHPVDPLIRFHYAVIRRHQARLARHGADTRAIWRELRPTFDAQVAGPCFEQTARYWARHIADYGELGGAADHVGPTTLTLPDGSEVQLDVVVATGDTEIASERKVVAIGEAKVGEMLTTGRLGRLEAARAALGRRAEGARLLLFGKRFSRGVERAVASRKDVELVGLERLYGA